jgi:hypothetical protein
VEHESPNGNFEGEDGGIKQNLLVGKMRGISGKRLVQKSPNEG